MNQRAGYDVLWLSEGEDGSGQPSPIRVWKTIRFVDVGEGYRVAFSNGPLTSIGGSRKTTLIKPDTVRSRSTALAGRYELTAAYTQKQDGVAVYIMRRIS